VQKDGQGVWKQSPVVDMSSKKQVWAPPSDGQMLRFYYKLAKRKPFLTLALGHGMKHMLGPSLAT